MSNEQFNIAADFTQAIQQLNALTVAFTRAAGGQILFTNTAGKFTQTLDKEGNLVVSFAGGLKGLDAEARKVAIGFGITDDRITSVTKSVGIARLSWDKFGESIKATLKEAAQLSQNNLKVPQISAKAPLESLFLKSSSGADPTLLKKFNEEFANLIELTKKLELQDKEIKDVFTSFFSKSPDTLLFGMRDLKDQLIKVDEAAKKASNSITALSTSNRVTALFKGQIAPALPVPTAVPTGKETQAITDAENALKTFLTNNTTFTKRNIDDTLSSINKGTIAQLGPVKKEFANLFLAAQKAYNDISIAAVESAKKQKEASDSLATKFGGVNTTGVSDKGLLAFEAAQRAVVSSFIRSKATISDFNNLLTSAGSNNRLKALPEELRPLYETMIRLITTTKALDTELTKAGKASVAGAQSGVVKQFADAKLTLADFQTALANVTAGTSAGIPASNAIIDFETRLKEAIDLTVKHGRTATQAAQEITAAIQAEIAAVTALTNKEAAEKAALQSRRSEAEAIVATHVSGVNTTGADETKLLKFEKAQRDIINLFAKLDISATDFDDLLTKAGSSSRLTSVAGEFQAIYEVATRLNTAVRALNSEFTKTGEAAVKASQESVVKQFTDAKITANEFKNSLAAVSAGTTTTGSVAAITDLETKIRESIDLTVKHGRTNTQAAQEIQAAIDAEIAALGARAAKEAQQEADDKIRAAERRARIEKEAAAQAEADRLRRVAIHPDVVSAFTQRDPAVNLPFNRPIPSFASAEQVAAINAGFQTLTANITQGNIKISRFREIVADVRRVLALPVPQQIFNPLGEAEQRIRDSALALETTFKSIENPATKAANSIIISWKGVFRLFQAQIIHTALAQLLSDFRQAAFQVGDFQKQIALIQTITQEQPTTFNEWADSVRRVSVELGKPAIEIATAAYDSLSNQITKTKDETEAFVKTAAQLARTTGGSTTESVSILSSAIRSFDNTAADAEDLAGKFFATVDFGRVKLSELATNFGRTTALAKSLGLGLTDILGGLTVITNAGVKSTEAQTQLNNVFIKLQKPTETMKELFKEFGVTSGEQLVRIHGFGGALQILAKAIQEGKGDLTDYFDELRGAKGFFTIAEDGAKNFNQALKDIADNQGRFQTSKAIIAAPAGVELQRQLAEIATFITEDFGGKAAAAIVSVTSSVGGLTKIFKTSFNAIQDSVTALTKTVLVFGTVAGTVFAVTTIKKWIGAIETAQIATKGLAFAWGELGAFITLQLEAHPILLLATAAATVAAAVAGLTAHFDRVKQDAADAFTAAKDAAEKNATDITNAFIQSNSKISEDLKRSVDRDTGARLAVVAEITKGLTKIAEEQATVIETVQSRLKVGFEGILDDFKNGIAESKKTIESSKKNIEEINKFKIDSAEAADKAAFDRSIRIHPEQKVPLTRQRENVLTTRAAQLLGDSATQAQGLNLLKQADDLEETLLDDVARRIELERKNLTQQQISLQTANARANVKLSQPYNELSAAIRRANLLENQSSSTREGSLHLDTQRQKAALAVNDAVLRTQNLSPAVVDPNVSRGFVANHIKINELLTRENQLGGDGVRIGQLKEQKAQNLANILAEATRAREQEAEQAKVQLDAQEVNVRRLQDLFKQLNDIKFVNNKGELVSEQEITRLKQRQSDIANEVLDVMQAQAKTQEVVTGKDESEQLFTKRAQFANNLAISVKAQNEQIENLRNVGKGAQAGKTIVEVGEDTKKRIAATDESVRKLEASFNSAAAAAKVLAGEVAQIRPISITPFKGLGIQADFSGSSKLIAQSRDLTETIDTIGGGATSPRAIAVLQSLQNEIKNLTQTDDVKAFSTQISQALTDIANGKNATETLNGINNALSRLKDARIGLAQEFNIKVQGAEKGSTIDEAISKLEKFRRAVIVAGDQDVQATITDEKNNVQTINQIDLLDKLKNKLDEAKKAEKERNTEQNRAKTDLKIESSLDLRSIFGGDPVDIKNDIRKRFATIRDVLTEETVETSRSVIDNRLKLKRAMETIEDLNRTIPKEFQAPIEQPNKLPPPTKFDPKELEDATKKAKEEQEKLEFGATTTLPEALVASTNSFDEFSKKSVLDIQAITNAINTSLIPALDNAKGKLAQQGTPETASHGGLFFARGGLVPIMTTPGEAFIPPAIAAAFLPQLMQMNRGFTPRFYNHGGSVGTDTQPALVPPGTFILNLQASRYFAQGGSVKSDIEAINTGLHADIGLGILSRYEATLNSFVNKASAAIGQLNNKVLQFSAGAINALTGVELAIGQIDSHEQQPFNQFAGGGFVPQGTDTQPALVPPGTFIMNKASTRRFLGNSAVQYFEQGGLALDSSFSPTLSTFNRQFNTNVSTRNEGNVNVGDIHINVTGKPNLSNSEQALQLGKALQRQIRIGRLK